MRDFIIRTFETLVWVFGGLIVLAGVVAGLVAMAQGEMAGLLMLIIAPLYAILVMGMFFIAIGIHANTKRTADAVEKLAARG
jgi:hypothetical protein